MLLRILISFLFLLSHFVSFAQKRFSYEIKDTLSNIEIAEINAATKNSSFIYYKLADSCSATGDSINAGNYLLNVDPYYLLYKNQTPVSIEQFLHSHFKITKQVRTKYIALFNKTYNAKKSLVYATFKNMAEEAKTIRDTLNKCMESKTYDVIDAQLRHTDSTHFTYLYNYVLKNGWPSLANGSIYAGLLVTHDLAHYYYYYNIVKEAITNGNLPIDILQSMVYSKQDEEATNYCNLIRSKYKFICFDISSVLKDNKTLPANMWAIINTVKKRCTDNLFIIFSNHKANTAWDWFYAQDTLYHTPSYTECALGKINMKLSDYMCAATHHNIYAMRMGLWGYKWQPTDDSGITLKLYITYGDNDTAISKPEFNKILTDNKFVTHAIHFDVKKSTIRPESIEFIKQLAAWLKTNPSIKLEIDGHTDSDGEATANLKLSQARADEVKKQLVAQGIATNRLTTQGFGATKPIAPNTTPEGKANNRRVEFIKK